MPIIIGKKDQYLFDFFNHIFKKIQRLEVTYGGHYLWWRNIDLRCIYILTAPGCSFHFPVPVFHQKQLRSSTAKVICFK